MMAARERKTGETFKQYRQNLKDHERWLKQRLKGQLLWDSKDKLPYRKL
jgi:hypothetical protein